MFERKANTVTFTLLTNAIYEIWGGVIVHTTSTKCEWKMVCL